VDRETATGRWRRSWTLLEKGRRSLLEKGLRQVAADADGRQLPGAEGGCRRRVAAAGRELYHGRWTLCNGEDWGKRRAEGVSNPRFGAREDGADLGLLNFAYDHVGAREYGAELAT
jgi:hypothetical protein